MADIKKVIETLDTAVSGYEKVVTKSQKKIYEEAITLLHDLDLKNGRVVQSIANLKRLNAIKAKLKAVSNNSEYLAGLGKFVSYFDALAREQREYFTQEFAEAALDKNVDREKRELIQKQAKDNTIAALAGDGLAANVTGRLSDMLTRAVTSGVKFSDLTKELHSYLQGEDGGQGALARYATTYATTAISQFTGQNNKIMTEGLDTDWFMYVGSTMETTREFCDCMVAKRYVNRKEFHKILSGNIDGHQCKMYKDLPVGMIADTNEENFQVNCGGWNCRHQLVPVHELAVPADVRARFERENGYVVLEPKDRKGRQGLIDYFVHLGYNEKEARENILYLDNFNPGGFKVSESETAEESFNRYSSLQAQALDRYITLSTLKDKLSHKEHGAISISKKIYNNKAIPLLEEAQNYDPLVAIKTDTYESVLSKTERLYRSITGHTDRMLDTRSIPDVYSTEDIERLAEIVGANNVGKMGFTHADEKNTNPEFMPGFFATDHNCQRCVIAFEMRVRGINVRAQKAKENDDEIWKLINGDTANAWIGEDGKTPKTIDVRGKSVIETENNIEKATKSTGRYVFYTVWKDGGAHVFNAIRGKSGALLLFDSQAAFARSIKALHLSTNKISVWRVDNAKIREEVLKLCVTPR